MAGEANTKAPALAWVATYEHIHVGTRNQAGRTVPSCRPGHVGHRLDVLESHGRDPRPFCHRAHVRDRFSPGDRDGDRRPGREPARRPALRPGVRRGGRRRAGLRGAGVGGRGVAARHALRGPARSAPRGRDDGGGSAGDRGRARNRPGAPQAGPGLRALDGRRRGEDRRARHRRRAGRAGPDRVRGRHGRPGTHRHAGPGPAALRRADRLLARPAWLRRVGASTAAARAGERLRPVHAASGVRGRPGRRRRGDLPGAVPEAEPARAGAEHRGDLRRSPGQCRPADAAAFFHRGHRGPDRRAGLRLPAGRVDQPVPAAGCPATPGVT